MKTVQKILLLWAAFTALHALLRLLYSHEMAAYEMSLPHCCHAMPPWLLPVAAAGDFCISRPFPTHPDLNSVVWGGAATLLCLAYRGRRGRGPRGRGHRGATHRALFPSSPRP